MNAHDLMAKAARAARSARVLLDNGDVEGASDRAYYAMFNAARAALLASGASVPDEMARTHNGLISSFSLQLVKTGRVPMDLGRALNRAEGLRPAADYRGDSVEQADAAWAVQQAEAFVETMQVTFLSGPAGPG